MSIIFRVLLHRCTLKNINGQTKNAELVDNFMPLEENVLFGQLPFPPPPLLFLFLMRLFSASNRRWGALAAGSNYLDPNSWGVIRETGRTIWLHDWHCLMIMGSSATLLWSTNHTGLAWTALNAKEPWPEYRAAAHSGSPSPHALQEVRRTAVAVTLHHLQHCH